MVAVFLHQSSLHFWGGGAIEVSGGSEGSLEDIRNSIAVGADFPGDVRYLKLFDLLVLFFQILEIRLMLDLKIGCAQNRGALPEDIVENVEILNVFFNQIQQLFNFRRSQAVVPHQNQN